MFHGVWTNCILIDYHVVVEAVGQLPPFAVNITEAVELSATLRLLPPVNYAVASVWLTRAQFATLIYLFMYLSTVVRRKLS